jgi:hypothetical protein
LVAVVSPVLAKLLARDCIKGCSSIVHPHMRQGPGRKRGSRRSAALKINVHCSL